ncbi:MAG: sigma-70 family RNA polymerase sigma factor, partial [Clostridia bacterium]|nr:sigma-70 family RNA polymerase sigma factor [Clostridia bacterium]
EAEAKADESLLDEICRKESYNEIITAILSLDERYRDVLTLYYLNDLSLSEIASLQGTKENTVKQQLYRGRRKLIDTIKKEVNPDEKRKSNA